MQKRTIYLNNMEEIGKKRKKWSKNPKEWAKLLNCSISSVYHKGEQWCEERLALLQLPSKSGKKAAILKNQLDKAARDYAAAITVVDDLTPEESQKQRIYRNTLAILDECLIFLKAARELTSEEARIINAQLKAVDIVVRLSS